MAKRLAYKNRTNKGGPLVKTREDNSTPQGGKGENMAQ